MFCQNCGKEIPEGASYCAYCGAKVNKVVDTPTMPSTNFVASSSVGERKSKVAAALFAFFLGIFGAHNFYLGHTNKAVAQLLITILSLFLLSFVTAIWSFIEFILILTGSIKDSSGRDLAD